MLFRKPLFFVFYLLILLSISILWGCEYHSDNEYFREVQKPDSAVISINLDPSDKIIYLAGIQKFNYLAVTDSLKCYNVKVFVDTTTISDKDEGFGSFTLNSKDYADGHYTLTLVATTSSGSGSLADIVGAEGFLFSFSWDLVVDKSPPTAVQITDMYNDDGLLKIEWGKYDKGNFGWYEVIKTVFSSSGIPYSSSIGNVYDITQNYFHDNTYLGGKAQYEVRVVTPLYKAATSEAKIYIDETISLQAEWLEEDLVKLSWTKIKYHKALKELRIYQNYMTVFTTYSADTNYFVGHIGIFGDDTYYHMEIFDQEATHWGKKYAEIHHNIGIPILSHKAFIMNNVNASVYLATASKLYKFNTETRLLEDSVAVPDPYTEFVVSPNDDILIASDPARKINPDNLSVSQPLDVYCKNLGSLTYDSKGIAKKNTEWTLYDFANSEVVSTFTGEFLYYKNFITGDGKYLFVQNITNLSCSKIENGQLIKQWEMLVSSFSLIPGEPDKFIILKDKKCEVRSVETNQVLSSFDVYSYWIYGVDATSKTVLFGLSIPDDRMVIYKYETGQKVKDFAYKNWSKLNYFRGSIYSANGFELPL